MRIVAGSARGRVLEGPKKASADIRPTADRVRESVFNILGQWLDGQAVLDLFAGTGALGLEAVSRGAARAVLVDQDREAIRLCQANAQALGFADRTEVLAMPVARALESLSRGAERFDLVLADPPYAARALAATAEGVAPLMTPEAVFCAEHDKREEAPERAGVLTRFDQRRFGDTVVSFYRRE